MCIPLQHTCLHFLAEDVCNDEECRRLEKDHFVASANVAETLQRRFDAADCRHKLAHDVAPRLWRHRRGGHGDEKGFMHTHDNLQRYVFLIKMIFVYPFMLKLSL